MKSYRKELWFNVPARREFINVTAQVEEALRESGIRQGLCLVNPMHITPSVCINDDESGLHHDYDQWLETLLSHEPVNQYHHNDAGEENADAHMKRQVMGRDVGAELLWGVRRRPTEEGAGEDHRRMNREIGSGYRFG